MAVWKFTMLFSQTSNLSQAGAVLHRVGGWSESWYITAANIQAVLTTAGGVIPPQTGGEGGAGGGGGGVPGFLGPANLPLFPARAALLPSSAGIVGLRIQQVDTPGPSQSFPANFPGSSGLKGDAPQQALLLRAVGLGPNPAVRRFTIRGIPDDMLIEGEFNPSAAYLASLNTYISSLASWAFRSKVAILLPVKLINITNAGVGNTEIPQAITQANMMIRVRKTKDSGGNLRSGRFQVTAVGPGNLFTLFNWPYGATTGGQILADSNVSYPLVDVANSSWVRSTQRKVGRPSGQYRGRRSRRR